MEQLLSIGIVGAIASFIIEVITTSKMSSFKKKIIAITSSLAIGTLYYLINGTELFTTILTILGTATLVYDYIIKPFKK
jgi:hypothetical protein